MCMQVQASARSSPPAPSIPPSSICLGRPWPPSPLQRPRSTRAVASTPQHRTPALTPLQATQSGPARPAAVSSRSSPPVHLRRVPTKGSSLAICAPPTSTLTISRQVPIGDWCQRKRYDESAKGLYAARPACTVHAWLLSCQLNEPNVFYDEMYNGDEILPPSNRYGTQTDWAALVSPIY